MKKREAVLLCVLAYAMGLATLVSNAAQKQKIQVSVQPNVQVDTNTMATDITRSIENSIERSVQASVEQSVEKSVEVSVQHHAEQSVDVDVDIDTGRDDWTRDYREKESDTIQHTYPVHYVDGTATIEVDNVFGSIDVQEGSSDKVELVVNRTIRAESKSMLDAARKEVTLDVDDKEGIMLFYVNGPFRCNDRGRCDCDCGGRDCGVHMHGDPGYVVKMDFQLKVPAKVKVVLRTVNDGNIKVHGVQGGYTVSNVNGGIEMLEMGGSGKATTVNGPVRVTFRENPREASSFHSINGNVELAFQKDLNADFYFKNFNGGVYTDFSLTTLPTESASSERRNGKYVIRTNRLTAGRVGNGGPEIRVENLNGEILIKERNN